MPRLSRIALFALLLTAMGVAPAAAADRPNVIFFLSDDQRADFLGCAGHPILKTPVLDRLAGDGVRFTNMFVTTSICAASRATLLTGTWERTHRYTFGTPPIAAPLCETSYPALMKKAGYRTGFVGKFGVGVAAGMRDRMFDYFKPMNRSPYMKKLPGGGERHETEIDGDLAITFLRETKTGQPFCLSVSFNAPHAEDADRKQQYHWPHSMDGMYDDVAIPKPPLSDPAVFESQPKFLKDSFNRTRWFWRFDTPEKYQQSVRGYYRMISGVDATIGRVLDEVRRLGHAENTVVVFSGDNGYYLGERGFAGKWSHYEESLRVPLIVFDPRLPKQRRGTLVDNVVLNVDLAPTFLDVTGIAIPPAYQGRSLMPLVRGESVKEWRTDFFCEHLMETPGIPKWEGVHDPRYVYANYFQQQPPYEFLHDLKADPQQLKNFATDPAYAATLKQMRERMATLKAKVGGEFKPWPKKGS